MESRNPKGAATGRGDATAPAPQEEAKRVLQRLKADDKLGTFGRNLKRIRDWRKQDNGDPKPPAFHTFCPLSQAVIRGFGERLRATASRALEEINSLAVAELERLAAHVNVAELRRELQGLLPRREWEEGHRNWPDVEWVSESDLYALLVELLGSRDQNPFNSGQLNILLAELWRELDEFARGAFEVNGQLPGQIAELSTRIEKELTPAVPENIQDLGVEPADCVLVSRLGDAIALFKAAEGCGLGLAEVALAKQALDAARKAEFIKAGADGGPDVVDEEAMVNAAKDAKAMAGSNLTRDQLAEAQTAMTALAKNELPVTEVWSAKQFMDAAGKAGLNPQTVGEAGAFYTAFHEQLKPDQAQALLKLGAACAEHQVKPEDIGLGKAAREVLGEARLESNEVMPAAMVFRAAKSAEIGTPSAIGIAAGFNRVCSMAELPVSEVSTAASMLKAVRARNLHTETRLDHAVSCRDAIQRFGIKPPADGGQVRDDLSIYRGLRTKIRNPHSSATTAKKTKSRSKATRKRQPKAKKQTKIKRKGAGRGTARRRA